MPKVEELSASLEDYLEVIFHIVKEKQASKAKDIADRLKVNNSSVTGALRSLSKKGYINYAPYDIITLTPKGKKKATDVIKRHNALLNFFEKVLNIKRKEAEEVACKMEHSLSKNILQKLLKYTEFAEETKINGQTVTEKFNAFCK